MKSIIKRFASSTRGAVAVIFGLAFVPLALFVGLAIDYSYYAEARSQVQIAADAAVTHAVRAAAGTYALELNQGTAAATASADAIVAGEAAGALWFAAQLGQLPTAYVPSAAGNNSCNGAANPCLTVSALTDAAGFSAAATYQGNYPPFFDNLFKTSAVWYIDGTSTAKAQYNAVEIMMLIDTSGSMLIGATAPDIALLEKYDVCPPTDRVTTVAGDNDLYIASRPDLVDGDNAHNGRTYQFRSLSNGSSPTSYGATTAENDDQVNFIDVTASHHMTNPSGAVDDSSGVCLNGGTGNDYQQPAFVDSVNNPGSAGVPCAFACHTTSNIYKGYYTDLYGFARYIGVAQEANGVLGLKLRIDYVLSATEQVITSMINNEQTSDEFSIGIYQFNTAVAKNVIALTAGTQGTPSDSAGDTSYEATYDLIDALTAVQNIDYQLNPAETTFPPLLTADDGNTNFTTAVTNFVAGKATGGTPLAAVNTGGANSITNPQKDIFIVTDGMEDECGSSCGATRVMGEMSSVSTEAPAGGVSAATGSCAKFKKLNYNVYVLYIDYDPVPQYTYYVTHLADPSATSPTDSFTNNDYNSVDNGSIQQMTTSASANNVTASVTGTYGIWGALSFPDDSPTEAALRACASVNPNGSAIGPTYFYVATSAAEIGTKLNIMLETALGSAIRITN